MNKNKIIIEWQTNFLIDGCLYVKSECLEKETDLKESKNATELKKTTLRNKCHF